MQLQQTTAFLNGELEEEVYMKQPEGFAEGQEDLVCKLKRSLKQSSRCWNSVLDNQLKQMGFVQAKGDPLGISGLESLVLIRIVVGEREGLAF